MKILSDCLYLAAFPVEGLAALAHVVSKQAHSLSTYLIITYLLPSLSQQAESFPSHAQVNINFWPDYPFSSDTFPALLLTAI